MNSGQTLKVCNNQRTVAQAEKLQVIICLHQKGQVMLRGTLLGMSSYPKLPVLTTGVLLKLPQLSFSCIAYLVLDFLQILQTPDFGEFPSLGFIQLNSNKTTFLCVILGFGRRALNF
jgi:hypothetical protein